MGSVPTEAELVLRLALAVALGTLVGLERESRHKLAGVRTHALVSLGAALFAIAGAFGVEDRDATRLAAQVVSGIGFIGAGAIVRSGGAVSGITTAATLWVAAALGIAAGFGQYAVASLSGLAALIVVTGFGHVAPLLLRRRRFEMQLSYIAGAGTLAPLFELVTAAGGHVGTMVMEEEDGTRHVTCTVRGVTSEAIDAIVERLAGRPEVVAISDNCRR